mgnify:CR=1 FL=1
MLFTVWAGSCIWLWAAGQVVRVRVRVLSGRAGRERVACPSLLLLSTRSCIAAGCGGLCAGGSHLHAVRILHVGPLPSDRFHSIRRELLRTRLVRHRPFPDFLCQHVVCDTPTHVMLSVQTVCTLCRHVTRTKRLASCCCCSCEHTPSVCVSLLACCPCSWPLRRAKAQLHADVCARTALWITVCLL